MLIPNLRRRWDALQLADRQRVAAPDWRPGYKVILPSAFDWRRCCRQNLPAGMGGAPPLPSSDHRQVTPEQSTLIR